MSLKPKRLIRGRRYGAPGFIVLAGVVIAGLALGACAHPPGRSPHHTPAPPASTKPAAYVYPNLVTYTAIHGLLFVRLITAGAHWPPLPGVHPHHRLHFVALTHGRVKNWRWTVLADKSLVPLYRVYRQRSPLRWSALMRRLRHAIGAVFPAPLPPIHFILRMAPADQGYATACHSFTRRVLRLCYAFPFRHRLGQDDRYWKADMANVSLSLSHETAIAVLANNQWGTPYQRIISKALGSRPGTIEAVATLFGMYFMQRFGALFPQFKWFILPPVLYGSSPARLARISAQFHITSDQLRNLMIGGTIAGLALKQTFGGYRVICSNDYQALRTYRALMARLVRDLPRLRALEPLAVRNMSRPFTGGSQVKVLTAHGVKSVPVKWLNRGPVKQGKAMWGGVQPVFFDPKAHSSKSDKIYLELCGPSA